MRHITWGVVALLLGVVSPAWAAYDEPRQWEISSEIYYFRYKEPDVAVKFEGPMYGVAAAFTHHHPNRLMFKAEGRGAWGQVDYTGSGTIDDITDWVVEGRLAAGYDVAVGYSQRLTPFFGVGYRYLNDDSSGRTSSTGALGYERESNYFYSPIGVEFHTSLNYQWTLSVSAEYDIFWKGQQKSHLEDADPSFDMVTNDQTRGDGVRGALTLVRTGERVDIAFGPYVRWWSIKDSETANVTYAGTIVGLGYEPKNETLEVGGTIAVRF